MSQNPKKLGSQTSGTAAVPAPRAGRHQLPDLSDPKILAELRDEGARLSQHPDNDAIDAWLNEVRDLDGWR